MKRRFAMLVFALAVAAGAPAFAQEGLFDSTPGPTSSPEPKSTPAETVARETLPSATSTPTAVLSQPSQPKRGWASRLLHPFSSGKPREPDYTNPKLRGLVIDLELTPQTVKLSEVRQLNVHVTLTNKSKHAVTLDFPNDQRIDIHLMNPAEVVLTRWSDNHAIKEKPGTLLINPQEHVEYKETIATRDLSPDKVYTVEVFFPKYPELRVRQKFLTAP
jgi:hypothetical protein